MPPRVRSAPTGAATPGFWTTVMTALGIGDGDVLLEGIQVKDPVVSCHWGIIGLTVRSGST